MEQRVRTLIDRLDALQAAHGGAIAQTYVASGNPDDEPHELTFAQFAGEVRRRANALVALGIGRGDVVGFAAPLSETSYPTMVAVMATATYAAGQLFPRSRSAGAYPQGERCQRAVDAPALRRWTGTHRQAQARACGASAPALAELRCRRSDRWQRGFRGDGRGGAAHPLAGAGARKPRNADRRAPAHRRHHRASETRAAHRGDVRRHDRCLRCW